MLLFSKRLVCSKYQVYIQRKILPVGQIESSLEHRRCCSSSDIVSATCLFTRVRGNLTSRICYSSTLLNSNVDADKMNDVAHGIMAELS